MFIVADVPVVVRFDPDAFHAVTAAAPVMVMLPLEPNVMLRAAVPVDAKYPKENMFPFIFKVPDVNVTSLVALVVKPSTSVYVPVPENVKGWSKDLPFVVMFCVPLPRIVVAVAVEPKIVKTPIVMSPYTLKGNETVPEKLGAVV